MPFYSSTKYEHSELKQDLFCSDFYISLSLSFLVKSFFYIYSYQSRGIVSSCDTSSQIRVRA